VHQRELSLNHSPYAHPRANPVRGALIGTEMLIICEREERWVHHVENYKKKALKTLLCPSSQGICLKTAHSLLTPTKKRKEEKNTH